MKEWLEQDCEGGFEMDGFEALEGAEGELEGGGIFEFGGEFGEDFGKELGIFEELECGGAGGVCEHAAEFLEDTFDADAVDLGGLLLDGEQSLGIEFEAEGGGEADGSEHTESIFAEAGEWISDGADELFLEVGLSADKIKHGLADGVEEHAVDGEVAALSVFFGGAEADGFGVSAIEVLTVAAEGGDFDLSVTFGGSGNHDNAEGGAYGNGAALAEGADDVFGEGVGGDVVVFGFFTEELVADAAAGPECMEACVAELSDDVECEFAAGIVLAGVVRGHSRDSGGFRR